MLKTLTQLWLRSVKKASKAQQRQNKKLLKAVSAPPATTRAGKPAATRIKPAKSVTIAVPERLPGKWLASYHLSFSDDKTLPVRRMAYRLYLPSAATTRLMPLVVMLHGCEQTAERFAQGTRFNHLAERNGFAVLYPQQSLKNHPNRCWHWYDRATQQGGGDVRQIAGVIEHVAQKHGIDRTRIYIAGLSAGASMANIVALHYPHLIAAVGMHSGTLFGAGHSRMGAYSVMQIGAASMMTSAIEHVAKAGTAFPPMPAILIHGQGDTVVRPINLAQSAHQFRLLNQIPSEGERPVVVKPGGKPGRKNAAHSYRIHDHYHGRKLMLRVCEISGLEHAWSGGDCTLRFNSCAGPDASKMMWNFFSRHRRLT